MSQDKAFRMTARLRVVSPTEGEFLLRMYGAPPVDPDAAGSAAKLPSTVRLSPQLEWLSALARETDLLVPEPVPTLDGSLIEHVSHHPQHPGRYCVLLRWVPGEHKGAAGYAPADISLLGSYVAGLHNSEACQSPAGRGGSPDREEDEGACPPNPRHLTRTP